MAWHLRLLGIRFDAYLIALGAIGVVLAVILVRDFAAWVDSWGWERTSGVVTSTRLQTRAFFHEIYYRYEVDGESCRGDVVRQSARRVGDPVRVLYNPESPCVSVLNRLDLFGEEHIFYALYLMMFIGYFFNRLEDLRDR